MLGGLWEYQECFEPAKTAREHVTDTDSNIQTWQVEAI